MSLKYPLCSMCGNRARKVLGKDADGKSVREECSKGSFTHRCTGFVPDHDLDGADVVRCEE